jgi:membrane protease YdiL (CAAX protease family)
MVVSQVLELGLCFGVLWIAIKGEGLRPSALGIKKPTSSTLLVAMVMLICLRYSGYATMYLTSLWHWTARSGMATSLAAQPRWMLVLISVIAGVAEESMYRGFAIAQVTKMTGSVWIAGLITLAAFTFGHYLSWGFGPWLVGQLVFAVIFTAFYIARRDLIANAAAHAMMDVCSTLGLWG